MKKRMIFVPFLLLLVSGYTQGNDAPRPVMPIDADLAAATAASIDSPIIGMLSPLKGIVLSVLLFTIALFLIWWFWKLIRKFLLWYWKIDLIEGHLKAIRESLEKTPKND